MREGKKRRLLYTMQTSDTYLSHVIFSRSLMKYRAFSKFSISSCAFCGGYGCTISTRLGTNRSRNFKVQLDLWSANRKTNDFFFVCVATGLPHSLFEGYIRFTALSAHFQSPFPNIMIEGKGSTTQHFKKT